MMNKTSVFRIATPKYRIVLEVAYKKPLRASSRVAKNHMNLSQKGAPKGKLTCRRVSFLGANKNCLRYVVFRTGKILARFIEARLL